MSVFCKSCKAPLVWALSVKGKLMPVDPDAVPNGNIVLRHDSKGLHAQVLAGKKLEAARLAGAELHLSHFVTCRDAEKFRK